MAGTLEKRGIDLVPENERYGKPRDLFFLWAGTTTNIFTVSYGAMLPLLYGLTLPESLLVILIGNLLAYPLLGFTSLQGPATGTTTMTISRSWLGTRGARMNGVFSWLMLLGFEAGGLILVYYAAAALLERFGIILAGPQMVVAVVVLAAAQAIMPLVGHRFLMAAQKYATIVFALAFAVLAVLIVPQVQLGGQAGTGADAAAGTSLATFVSAISLVMVSGGLSWAPSGGNFSRYLPIPDNSRGHGKRATGSGQAKQAAGSGQAKQAAGSGQAKRAGGSTWAQIAWAASLGGFVPYVLLQSLGAAMATVAVGPDVDLSNPLAVPAVLPAAFAIPFLLLVMFGLLIQNGTNLYSSGLNLQTAGFRVSREKIVILDSVICAVVAVVAVSQSSFYDLLNAFVASLSIWLAPWVAVYVCDAVSRAGRYDLAGLAAEGPGGPYWGRAGIRWDGMGAMLAGMVAAWLFSNTGYFTGPLAAAIAHGAGLEAASAPDLSIAAGALVASFVFLLARRGKHNVAALPQNNETRLDRFDNETSLDRHASESRLDRDDNGTALDRHDNGSSLDRAAQTVAVQTVPVSNN
ncbi:purine-cytosine permease family protein [Actinobaculum suis]|uniref:purine-cytosine permease family protein n=1 Tax=Actinobaculum suis TaxID=1657 RepID=UPI00080A6132|nr:cytosine permease [Actinobaculum suis]OCA96023.1 thiamine permease [Actinobaculum suis]